MEEMEKLRCNESGGETSQLQILLKNMNLSKVTHLIFRLFDIITLPSELHLKSLFPLPLTFWVHLLKRNTWEWWRASFWKPSESSGIKLKYSSTKIMITQVNNTARIYQFCMWNVSIHLFKKIVLVDIWYGLIIIYFVIVWMLQLSSRTVAKENQEGEREGEKGEGAWEEYVRSTPNI